MSVEARQPLRPEPKPLPDTQVETFPNETTILQLIAGAGLGAILVATLLTTANYFRILPLSSLPGLRWLPVKPEIAQTTPVLHPRQAGFLNPADVKDTISLACPVERALCDTGTTVSDNSGYHGLGFNLPPGTPIRAVMDGELSDLPKPEGRDPDQPLLYIRDTNGNQVLYSFYGQAPRTSGAVQKGDLLGIAGDGQFPPIPPFTGLNFYFSLQHDGRGIAVTPADLAE